MSIQKKYSVVVPVFNSATMLAELCNRIAAVLSSYSFEIVLIDDCSTDDSWNAILKLKTQYKEQLKAILLQKNFGQHPALLCGFTYCTGDYIITIDDDLQYAPEDILKLIAEQEKTEAEIVYGMVEKKQQSVIRNAGSAYVQHSSRLLENKSGIGSPFRLMSKTITNIIAERHRQHFVFIDEVIQWYATKIAYVSIIHYPRKQGKSGYTFLRLVKLYFNILINYSALPLKLMTYAGGISSFIFFIAGIIFFLRKLEYNVPVGYTSIIVAILLSASIIMLCLGIVGQYLFKIYLSQQNKPVYSIKQIV